MSAECFMNSSPLENPWMPHLTISLIYQCFFPIFITSIFLNSDSMQIFWHNYFSPFLQDSFPSHLLAGQERKGAMQDLHYLAQKIQRDLLFSCILTVSWMMGISEEGPCYKLTCFPPSFLALLRRPLWKGLTALWDKPSSANDHRSKAKLNSREWKPDKMHYKSWHSNWELSNANCSSVSGLPQCPTRGQIRLSLMAWSILLIFTGTSHLIKTSKIWSLKRLKVW